LYDDGGTESNVDPSLIRALDAGNAGLGTSSSAVPAPTPAPAPSPTPAPASTPAPAPTQAPDGDGSAALISGEVVEAKWDGVGEFYGATVERKGKKPGKWLLVFDDGLDQEVHERHIRKVNRQNDALTAKKQFQEEVRRKYGLTVDATDTNNDIADVTPSAVPPLRVVNDVVDMFGFVPPPPKHSDVGKRIEARRDADEDWLIGEIVNVQDGDYVDVKIGDGTVLKGIHPCNIRDVVLVPHEFESEIDTVNKIQDIGTKFRSQIKTFVGEMASREGVNVKDTTERLFSAIQNAKDGKVHRSELAKCSKQLGCYVAEQDMQLLMECVDADCNGISFDELWEFLSFSGRTENAPETVIVCLSDFFCIDVCSF
jgi:hypothetical protein